MHSVTGLLLQHIEPVPCVFLCLNRKMHVWRMSVTMEKNRVRNSIYLTFVSLLHQQSPLLRLLFCHSNGLYLSFVRDIWNRRYDFFFVIAKDNRCLISFMKRNFYTALVCNAGQFTGWDLEWTKGSKKET